MDLFEFEGAQLYSAYGIPTCKTAMVTNPTEPAPLAFPLVLKAQALIGGRGKAGGVRVVKDQASFEKDSQEILDLQIKGHRVYGLMAAEMCAPQRELYLAITLQGVQEPTLICSAVGGMDIEQISETNAEAILKLPIDPFTGFKGYQLNYIAHHLQVDKAQLSSLLSNLWALFKKEGAILTEINPLVVADGKLIALDSKVILDDHSKANVHQRAAFMDYRIHQLFGYECPKGEETTVTYVPLEGTVGLISDGAGTGMLTLDLLRDAGADVACFTELGGMITKEVMYRAMELTLGNHPNIEKLLIVLIGGFNRMDNMARGITSYVQEHNVTIPIYTRMCGNMEKEGIEMMHQAGLKTYYDLSATVQELCAPEKEA